MLISLTALLMLGAAADAAAQRLRGDRPQPVPAKTEVRRTAAPVAAATPDTVYATQTYKRNGWFGPLDEISAEDARHRDMSVRFTRRSPKGKWLRLETVNAYGDYVGGGFGPYLIKLGNEGDSGADRAWAERLATTCIYDLIPDASGDNVVQERAYDKDMNLVYIYTRTPIGTDDRGRRRYVGNYRDYLGRPAEMRPDSTGRYTYGSLVMLTEDRYGNDSIVEYMDARGVKKPNGDGVAMEVYTYDSRGDCVRTESRDAAGRPVIDVWTNCGIIARYDDRHNTVVSTYTDTLGRPMMMHSPFKNENNGAASVLRDYDRYRRITRVTYADTLGRPCTTDGGVARVEVEYDDRGNTSLIRYLGADSLPHNHIEGYATQYAGYDSLGRPLYYEWLDDSGRPNQDEQYLSKFIRSYDAAGRDSILERYEADGDRHVLIYREQHTPTYNLTTFRDGSTRLDSIDASGRTTYTAFRNPEGAPETVGQWATAHYIYRDTPGVLYNLDLFFDDMERPAPIGNGYVAAEYVTDSTARTYYTRLYDADGHIFESNIKSLDQSLSNVTGQYDINRFGRPCRAGSSSQVRFYYADAIATQNSDNPFSALIGRDEFGEPDYIFSPWTLYYYMRNDVYHDEDDRPVDDVAALIKRLPKVMSIEVTDSAAYRLGLLDNDVIVADGVYCGIPRDSVDIADFRSAWALASVTQPRGPRTMTVLRADTAARAYRAVTIEGIEGTPSQNGFIVHERFLTRRQAARMARAIASLPAGTIPEPAASGSGNIAIFTMADMYGSERHMAYPANITDAATLLAVSIPDEGMSWRMGEPVDTIHSILSIRDSEAAYRPMLEMRYTTDGRTMRTLRTRDARLAARFFSNYIPDGAANHLSTLARAATAAADSSMRAAGLPGKIHGTYALPADTAATGFTEIFTLIIDKHGRYRLVGHTVGIIKLDDGCTVVMRVNLDSTALRPLRGRAIDLTADATYTCVDILNLPEGDPEQMRAIVDDAFADPERRDRFIAMLKWLSPTLTPKMYINIGDDGRLSLIGSNGKETVLTKVK